MTHYQPEHPQWKYIDHETGPSKVDFVMATYGSQRALDQVRHPRRIMYWQETSEARPPAIEWSKRFAGNSGLVLANDQRVLDAVPYSRYMTLFGIRMPRRHYENLVVPFEERKGVSLMGSRLKGSSGHKKRWEAFNAKIPGVIPYGFDGVPYWKRDSLSTYRYSIVCESANYPYWHTEKLWDCFAMKTIPIYWGCPDTTRLQEYGFDPHGIIFWNGDIERLKQIVRDYDDPTVHPTFARAADWNRNTVLLLPQQESSFLTLHLPLRLPQEGKLIL